MIVVSNAGPLIALARIGRVSLLPALFGAITIPPAVRDEILLPGPGRAGGDVFSSAAWLRTESVKDLIAVQVLEERLGKGESEAIVLAAELDADLLLMDEERGRRRAAARGLGLIGTLGALVLAKQAAKIPAVSPLLDDLTERGFRMDEALRARILELAGEAGPSRPAV